MTFELLNSLYSSVKGKADQIQFVKDQLVKWGKNLQIHYKTKETKLFKVDVLFEIMPTNGNSKMVIKHLDKRQGKAKSKSVELLHYEDIYSLVKRISIHQNEIVFKPNDSNYAKLATKNYQVPITLKIDDMA